MIKQVKEWNEPNLYKATLSQESSFFKRTDQMIQFPWNTVFHSERFSDSVAISHMPCTSPFYGFYELPRTFPFIRSSKERDSPQQKNSVNYIELGFFRRLTTPGCYREICKYLSMFPLLRSCWFLTFCRFSLYICYHAYMQCYHCQLKHYHILVHLCNSVDLKAFQVPVEKSCVCENKAMSISNYSPV